MKYPQDKIKSLLQVSGFRAEDQALLIRSGFTKLEEKDAYLSGPIPGQKFKIFIEYNSTRKEFSYYHEYAPKQREFRGEGETFKELKSKIDYLSVKYFHLWNDE